jgi:hypothetical protein
MSRESPKDSMRRADMFNRHHQTDRIMSTNAVSASNQINLSALLGSPKVSQRHSDDRERESSGGNPQGITLLASLLQALVQAATSQPASAATPAAGTPAPSTPPATGAAAPPATSAAPSATLVQDLQAFLHDLFRALRHANRESDGDRIVDPRGPATPTSGTAATPPAPAPTPVTAPAPTPVTAASTVTAHYRHHGIIYALQGLIRDLGASQAPDSTGSPSGASSTALTKLNAAFVKLLGDLTGSASGGSAAGSGQSTSALQSFLTNFLQDLQSNASVTFNTLGSSVNTTA